MHPSLESGRRALLHAHRALGAHAEALILVGAQAIQEWAGEADEEIGGSPESRDADVQVDAAVLGPDPTLENAMLEARFRRTDQPGTWISSEGTQVDLLVAEAQARGGGTRSAGLDTRDPKSARRVVGLECCLVLNQVRRIMALGAGERETVTMRVARPAALLVAKAHKLGERVGEGGMRARPKDALDVLRLLQLGEPRMAVHDFRTILADARCGDVANRGRTYFRELFGKPNAPGCGLLRSGYPDRGEVLAARAYALASDFLKQL